jgi:TonB family protein
MDLVRGSAYHATSMARLQTPHRSTTPRRFLGLCFGLSALGCASAPPPAASSPAIEPSETPTVSETAAPAASEQHAPAPPPSEPADTRGKEQIQAIIAANRERVRACYVAVLPKNPGIQGDLVIGFVINPDGSVKSAEVNTTESELHVPELDSCAVDVLKTLKFPASSRGLESKVNYPFNFKP